MLPIYSRRSKEGRGAVEVVYCPSEDMLADLLTKSLPKWKVASHATTLGLRRACGGVLE